MNEHLASISALPTNISELMSRWHSIGAFAADVGCGYEAARQRRRLGIAGVSYEWLAGHRATASLQGEAA